MPSNDWPSKWPVEPIPTKPLGPPYFVGDFKLKVMPEEFILYECRPFKTFWFQIKNPLKNVSVEYSVNVSGRIRIYGLETGFLGPSEESLPTGVMDGLTYYEKDGTQIWWAPPLDPDERPRSIWIEYWPIDKEKAENNEEDYRLKCNEIPKFYPKLTVMPDFNPIMEPEPFKEWKPVVDKKKKLRCVIL